MNAKASDWDSFFVGKDNGFKKIAEEQIQAFVVDCLEPADSSVEMDLTEAYASYVRYLRERKKIPQTYECFVGYFRQRKSEFNKSGNAVLGIKFKEKAEECRVADKLCPAVDSKHVLNIDVLKSVANTVYSGPSRFMQFDTIQKAQHYNSHPSGVECITVAQHESFCIGNVFKYLWRAGIKSDRLEDLKKAQYYLNKEIQNLETQEKTK